MQGCAAGHHQRISGGTSCELIIPRDDIVSTVAGGHTKNWGWARLSLLKIIPKMDINIFFRLRIKGIG